MSFNTDAVVLKITKTGESDRLVTFLTRDKGTLKAFAKAADRPKNKLHMATNLFCYGNFTFYEGTSALKVTEADLTETFFGLQSDISKLSLAQYFNELMIECAPVETEANEYLRLLLNSLYFLANDKKNKSVLKAVFELRLSSLIGYMPSLVACKECGEFETEEMFFNPFNGELHCNICKGKDANKYPLEVITAMRHIIFSEQEKMFSPTVSKSNINMLGGACEKYLMSILKRKFTTLDFYNSIK